MAIILSGTALTSDLATIRDGSAGIDVFRAAVERVGLHLAAETSKHLPSIEVDVVTPLETTSCAVIDGSIILVSILRAGLGLLSPFLMFLPMASVGFIGLKRNELSLEPAEYYRKLPASDKNTSFIVIDPMLATGGSLLATLALLKSVPHRRILAACLIAAPEGVARIEAEHPDVLLVSAALDRQLSTIGYILPGLGDAGDRLFGTV